MKLGASEIVEIWHMVSNAKHQRRRGGATLKMLAGIFLL